MARTPGTFPDDARLRRMDYCQAPATVYFFVSTDDWYRRSVACEHCVLDRGRLVRPRSPDHRKASCRVFFAATRVCNLDTRLKDEFWRLSPAQCDRQLRAAEFLGQLPTFIAAYRIAT